MPNQPIDYSDTVICKIVCNDKNRQQYKDTDNLRRMDKSRSLLLGQKCEYFFNCSD